MDKCWCNEIEKTGVFGGRHTFGRTAAYVPALAVKDLPLGRTYIYIYGIYIDYIYIYIYTQGGGEISVIISTDDYLCYKGPKIPFNFFTYFNI